MDLCTKFLSDFCKTIGGISLVVSLSACQKSGGGTSVAVEQALSCPSGQMKSDPEMMHIEGAPSASVGQVVQYKLNSDALCSGAQKVLWNTPGAEKIATGNGALAAKYQTPGDYYVSAKLVGGTSESADMMQKTLVMGEQIQFSGPQVTFEYRENTFSLTAPAGVTLTSVIWNFGDGNTQTTTNSSIVYAYPNVGEYTMSVTATDSNGVVTSITHDVSVIPGADELFCAVQLTISGPSQTNTGATNVFSMYIPSCLRSYMTGVEWKFGDNTNGTGETTNKIYDRAGDYTIEATLRLNHVNLKQVTISRSIQVNEAPVDNNKCSTQGQTRETISAQYTEEESCGVNGKKILTYQDRKQESCERVDTILDWVTTSTVKEKIGEGPCTGQSCPVPGVPPSGVSGLQFLNGQYYLADGGSLTFFTQTTPTNSCDQNKEVRLCNNGVLSGSSTAIHYQCQSGCGDFGPDGTVKTGILVGTHTVAVQCQFDEQGIFDLFNEIEDRSCSNGTVSSSNRRLGDLISKGLCPTYAYHATSTFTTCTADCGGQQNRIYECRNNLGQAVTDDRCGGQQKPVETRICDGNPEAVRRVDVITEEQTDNSKKCPKDQIGVIINTRNVITKNTYACINHTVALENTEVENSPWMEERYCRNYVAHRCSNDSLNNTEAHNRYLWMKKCAPTNTMLAEFLENFDNISAGNNNIDTSKRKLYPTFMNSAFKPEKVWVAPKTANASCDVPSTVYIAAVCVSSCAIPQEQILAQESAARALSPVAFIEALTKNYSRVGTLTANSDIQSKKLKSSKVEQWITELEDTEQPVLVLTMKSGQTLTVTPNHPLLRADGSMDVASNFKTSDALVKLGGGLDPIVSIESTQYFGKVYNLFVKSSVPQENIVVTNGYLNGSAFFQNEGADHVNKQLLRFKLTKGIFNQ